MSEDQFTPGEIALFIGGIDDSGKSYGVMECTILAEPKTYDWRYGVAGTIRPARYVIRLSNGETVQTMPDRLRKKPQPGDRNKLVRWADCPWQPKHLKV